MAMSNAPKKRNTTQKNVARTKNDDDNYIVIKGARVNNLKNIDVRIPRNKLVVITGLSKTIQNLTEQNAALTKIIANKL